VQRTCPTALVATYVEATNSFDIERLMATFAEDALVNDQLRDHWGKPAIREWVKREIIGVRVTMNVTKVINHYGNFIVTANVDGNYDKRGLPDPLVLAFYFTAQSDLIVQLIILRNRRYLRLDMPVAAVISTDVTSGPHRSSVWTRCIDRDARSQQRNQQNLATSNSLTSRDCATTLSRVFRC
jgi:phosphatidate phosphatase APP1